MPFTQEQLLAGYRSHGLTTGRYDGMQFKVFEGVCCSGSCERPKFWVAKGIVEGMAITNSEADARDWVAAHSGVVVN